MFCIAFILAEITASTIKCLSHVNVVCLCVCEKGFCLEL